MLPRTAKLTILMPMFALIGLPTFAQVCAKTNTCPKQPVERRVQPEPRREEPETERRRPEPSLESRPENRPENRPYNPAPESRPSSHMEPASRPEARVNRANTAIYRPNVITPMMRRAMTYNTRPGGVRIFPDYFASHYGPAHGFHFIQGAPTYGLTLFNGEWYFNWNGGTFGVMGLLPGNWGLQADYLYIDIGDDGNYYLYDSQFPGFAVQLTFVLNVGDDQADGN